MWPKQRRLDLIPTSHGQALLGGSSTPSAPSLLGGSSTPATPSAPQSGHPPFTPSHFNGSQIFVAKRRPCQICIWLGSFPDLSDIAAREAALKAYDEDAYAASPQVPQPSKLATVRRMLATWGLELLPLTTAKIRILEASLKAGGTGRRRLTVLQLG